MNVKELLGKMTLEEKIGQLAIYDTGVFCPANKRSDVILGFLQDLDLDESDFAHVGNALTVYRAEDMIALQKRHMEADRLHIPMLFFLDVIHGFRTIYPIPLAMGCSFDPLLMEACARIAAKEAASAGVCVAMSPMVDVVRNPRWGRVMESFGESALLNGVMGSAQVRGMQGDDLSAPSAVAACVKHFAAYGAAEGGRDYNTVEISERILREYYLPAYKMCLDAGARVIMPAFEALNGVPVTANPLLMQQILRKEWGFDGVAVSDWGAVGELCVHGIAKDMKTAAKLAIENGCNVEMMTSGYQKHLAELVRDGTVSEETVDRLAEAVLTLKQEMGLFGKPYREASAEREAEVCLTEESRATVRRAAEESAVLLKNDAILPFSEGIRRIALIGPYADTQKLKGNWSFTGSYQDCVSVRAGIAALLPDAELVVETGCSFAIGDTDGSGIPAAVAAAKGADAVVLCLGEGELQSGESNCRTDLGLPGVQAELARAVLAVNPNTAVVLFNGRPLVLTELDGIAPAILEMWFPGTEGGNAVAELLFGRAVPCGKVCMSFPRAVGQIPVYHDAYRTGRPKTKPDGEFEICISNYLDCGNTPLYPFGYGLSYTSFAYSELVLDRQQMTEGETLTARVKVKNTGNRTAKETVQFYLRDMVASVVRPVQQLIGFQKIELVPGEEKTVSFEVTEPMLRFYDFGCNCISEAGEFRLSVGYADHPVLTEAFELVK